MRAVVQRVEWARVTVDNEVVGETGRGILALVGVEEGDTQTDLEYVVEKLIGLRIFNDEQGKFNLSLEDTGGDVMVVSQFTLHGDARRGRRPSFIKAARPEEAIPLYEGVAQRLRERGVKVATGRFGAHMLVESANDGPVTILLDSRKLF